jgi:hypothetical protein
MAYVNISMGELVYIIKQNMEDTERIKDIRVINDCVVELVVSIGPFFPEIKVGLTYNRFSEGRLYLNVLSSGSVKIIMGLMNELYKGPNKDVIKFSGQNIIVDVNKVVLESVQGVAVKNINMTGNQIYIETGIL